MTTVPRSPSERNRIYTSFQDQWIPTPKSHAVEDILSSSIVAPTGQISAAGRASLTVLEAAPECGATSMVRRAVESSRGTALYIDIHGPCTPPVMATLILHALADPCAHRHDAMMCLTHRRILTRLNDQQISSVVFDHFERGLDVTTGGLQLDAAGWFAALLTAVRRPVVLVGGPGLAARLCNDPGAVIRSDHTLRLTPLTWPGDKHEVHYILEEFEAKLSELLTEPTHLTAATLPKRLYEASQGSIGRLARLLRCALRIAIHRDGGPDRITESDLADAFDSLDPTAPNPFIGDDLVVAA